jgi:hypothetical protein
MVDFLQYGGSIFLTIKTNIYDINRKNTGTHAEYIQEDKKYWNCVGIS